METKKWRIFLSYRGGTESEAFCQKLYDSILANPNYINKYGEVYFSPVTGKGRNYMRDIPSIMEHVEEFVVPLTRDYFEGFWDEAHRRPNEDSPTYLEIQAAIERKAHFVCINWPDYVPSHEMLWLLFNQDALWIDRSIRIKYNVTEQFKTINEVKRQIRRPNYNSEICGIPERLKKFQPNIYLTTKGETELPSNFPFDEKLYGVRKIYMLNFAGTSFISNADVADIYKDNTYLKHWFFEHLRLGEIQAQVILTHPRSPAAEDAAKFKMYPEGMQEEKYPEVISPKDAVELKRRIIPRNLNKLFEFKQKYPQIRLDVFLTDISLPYGIMLLEYGQDHSDYNHMKVDLYSAVLDDDKQRPSFYLMENNQATRHMYDFFRHNLQRIRDHYSIPFNGHPQVTWLAGPKAIIHRGVISRDLMPHTRRAFEACIKAGFPMEVDLLRLKNSGTIIVGRDDQDISRYGVKKKLSECSMYELYQINQQAGEDSILTLEDFLALVGGRVPVLLEIKTSDRKACADTVQYVEEIVKILHGYLTQHVSFLENERGPFAIHSANPYVLREIKARDCLVPCGIISTDFSHIRDDVGEEFYTMHRDATYMDIFEPDFISYDVRYLHNGIAKRIQREKHIPVLAWTIMDESRQIEAEDGFKCDNIIIEGATTYRANH